MWWMIEGEGPKVINSTHYGSWTTHFHLKPQCSFRRIIPLFSSVKFHFEIRDVTVCTNTLLYERKSYDTHRLKYMLCCITIISLSQYTHTYVPRTHLRTYVRTFRRFWHPLLLRRMRGLTQKRLCCLFSICSSSTS